MEEVSIVSGKKKMVLNINKLWCKGCGICVEFCPTKALELDEKGKAKLANPDKCNGCRICELRCPDFAIEIR